MKKPIKKDKGNIILEFLRQLSQLQGQKSYDAILKIFRRMHYKGKIKIANQFGESQTVVSDDF